MKPEKEFEELLKAIPPKRKKPKLICLNGRIIAEAVVIVGEKDPNWWREAKAVLTNGVVTVKLPRRI
jgi:hypothetical protein